MRSLLLLSLGAVLALGCEGGVAPSAPFAIEPVELGFDGRTTDGLIAARNLDAQIDGLRAALDQRADDDRIVSLSALLMARAQFFGAIEDVEEARSLSGAVRDDATRATLSGGALSALHRWDEALDVLPADDAIRDSILVARSLDLDRIADERQAAADRLSTFDRETDLAIALAELGRFDDADEAYLRALRAYRDVSPFPVAFVQFQRGVLWAERAGRPGRAVPLYREAVRRLPGYVVAQVHLAELEAELGDVDAALGRLTPLIDGPDPEAAGLASELLAERDEDASADALAAASARYEVLLDLYALAYADHGAEFFLGPGNDPARALAFALANLANRNTERAAALAVEAALATDQPALGCEIANRRPDAQTAPLIEALEALGACER